LKNIYITDIIFQNSIFAVREIYTVDFYLKYLNTVLQKIIKELIVENPMREFKSIPVINDYLIYYLSIQKDQFLTILQEKGLNYFLNIQIPLIKMHLLNILSTEIKVVNNVPETNSKLLYIGIICLTMVVVSLGCFLTYYFSKPINTDKNINTSD
jgi:hypothetical protein